MTPPYDGRAMAYHTWQHFAFCRVGSLSACCILSGFQQQQLNEVIFCISLLLAFSFSLSLSLAVSLDPSFQCRCRCFCLTLETPTVAGFVLKFWVIVQQVPVQDQFSWWRKGHLRGARNQDVCTGARFPIEVEQCVVRR